MPSARARFAVISSPRSANTWLRRLLAELFDLSEHAAFTPDELDWEGLPERCIIQLHWPRTPTLVKQLRQHDFNVCVLMRHPLDALISILHFAANEPLTAHWLGGAYGDEHTIVGVEPCSAEFVDYAISPRARALIGVSSEWWNRRAAARIRFEDLVVDPASQLQRVAASSRIQPNKQIDEVVRNAALGFSQMQSTAPNQHFWQGQPELWRRLLPPTYAAAIAAPYRTKALRRYRYRLEPDRTLSLSTAQAEWQRRISPSHGVDSETHANSQ
jgi:hypothetical protein